MGGKGRCTTSLSPSRLLVDLLTCLQSLSDLDPIMPFQLSLAAAASAVMGCDGCFASAAVGELASEPSLGRGAGRGLQASLPPSPTPLAPSRLFSIPSLFVPCHAPSPPSHNKPSLLLLLLVFCFFGGSVRVGAVECCWQPRTRPPARPPPPPRGIPMLGRCGWDEELAGSEARK